MNGAVTVREGFLRMKPDHFLTGAARIRFFTHALTGIAGVSIRQKRSIRILRRACILAASVGLIGLAALWLTFQHKPGWYRPATLDPAGLHQARREATNTLDSIGDRIVRGEPFDLVLSKRSVNEWLAVLPQLWPDVARHLGSQFIELAVDFDSDGIRVGALYTRRGWRVIASVDLKIAVTQDGRFLQITLPRLRGGSLPLPGRLLESLLEPLIRQGRTNPSSGASAFDPIVGEIGSAGERVAGVRLRNRFIWPNGRRALRFASIEVKTGELHLRIEPL